MKLEIEIKLRLRGDLAKIRKKLRSLGFRVVEPRVLESNVLLDNAKQALRKHGRLIRVRRVGGHSVLTYKGPGQPGKYKKREEDEIQISDAAVIERIFAHIGFHPVFRYDKFRTEYAKPPAAGKVMLDETPIGSFLEIEGSARWIDRTARALGFSASEYITRSYGFLYMAYCRERRIRPRDMLFKRPALKWKNAPRKTKIKNARAGKRSTAKRS